MMSAQLRAFLFLIRWAEGTSGPDGYRTMVGGEKFTDMSDHPRKVRSGVFGNGKAWQSSAAGAYQFLTASWDRAKAALDLPDFDQDSQDRAAVWLIEQRKALPFVERGDLKRALELCSWEWASLPPDRYGQPVKSYEACATIFERAGGTISQAAGAPPQGSPMSSPSSDAAPPVPFIDKVRNTVSPLLIPAISAVVDAIPSLVKLFGSGSKVAERNAKAVSVVADVVRTVTKEPSVAAGVEKVLADPAMQEEVERAVQARWYELSEVGGGIEAARKHDAEFRAKGDSVWKSPSFVVALLLIPLVYVGMVSASLKLPIFPDWPFEIRVAIVSSVIGMVLGGIVGYYFGMMTSRNRAAVVQEGK